MIRSFSIILIKLRILTLGMIIRCSYLYDHIKFGEYQTMVTFHKSSYEFHTIVICEGVCYHKSDCYNLRNDHTIQSVMNIKQGLSFTKHFTNLFRFKSVKVFITTKVISKFIIIWIKLRILTLGMIIR